MNNIILTLILTSNLLILLSLLYVFARVKHLFTQAKTFITPESEGKPSPLAEVTQVFADMMGRGISASLKSTFMGKQSVANKNEARIEGDIALDTLAMANPLLGTIVKSFPVLGKTLRRNPELVDVAVSKLFSKLPTGQPEPPGDGQVKFNL